MCKSLSLFFSPYVQPKWRGIDCKNQKHHGGNLHRLAGDTKQQTATDVKLITSL